MDQMLLIALLAAVNAVSLAIFGIDKLKSKRGSWRIAESKLLAVAFFAPFGAFLGMLLFKHKIRKIKFMLVPLFLAIQAFFVAYFWGKPFF